MIKFLKEWSGRYLSDPQVIILALLLSLGFFLILTLGKMLAPVIAALVIAYLLEGLVAGLSRLGTRRMTAVVLVFSVFMTALLTLLVVLLPMLSHQVGQLISELPEMVQKGREAMTDLPERYPDIISEAQIQQILEALAGQVTAWGQRLISLSLASLKGVITFVVYLILVPFLVFFFLKDKNLILDWIRKFLPRERMLAASVWREANRQVGNYVRGKALEISLLWVATYITYLLLGLDFAMLVAIGVAVSVIIPYIGTAVVTIPVVLIAFFQWGFSINVLYVLIAYFVLHTLDANLLVPLLLSGVVNLHPVAIIVALLVFGGLWGVWGLFFAIPLATLVQAVINAWFARLKDTDNPANTTTPKKEENNP